MLSIREATVADIPAIQKIAHATWPIAYGDIISETQIAYMLNMMYSTTALVAQMTTRQHRFFIATLNDDAVGFAAFECDADNTACRTQLHKLYCHPTAQKNGIGVTLIQAVVAAAIAASQHTLRLNVNKKNKAASFYQRHGFSIIDQIVVDIGQGFVMDDFVMEKRL
jgi:diamine N-acetyltransferase